MNANLCAECGLKIPTGRSKQARFCDSKCRDKHAALRRKRIGRSAADQSRDRRLGLRLREARVSTLRHVLSDKLSAGAQRRRRPAWRPCVDTWGIGDDIPHFATIGDRRSLKCWCD
jgi:hypothetical protein